MRKTFLTLLFALSAFISAGAVDKEWIDITTSYIVNPDFKNNDITTGWQGDGFGAANPKENAEHYQRNYNSYQTITGLRAGKYRVSMKGFYRMGSSTNDASLYSSGNYSGSQYAKLYANSSVGNYSTSIAPLASGATSGSYGGATQWITINGSWKMVPNNMESASLWFENGYYDNSVECEVGTDGILTIGISKNYTISEDWTCIDTWRLEYWGEPVKITSVAFDKSTANMLVGEKKSFNVNILPDDASQKTLKWLSSNTRVATVDADGLVKAVAKGSTVLRATTTDGTNKYATLTITVGEPVVPTAANLIINEVMAANVDVYRDPSTNFGSWVELYNPGEEGVTLAGLIITLTDADGIKSSWQLHDDYGVLPSEGYALLNFDHYEQWTELSYRQINGKLDCDGGTVSISNASGVLATFTYPAAKSRMSYARTADGGDTWGWTGNPTPGETNAKSLFATMQLAAPVVTPESQVSSSDIAAVVTIPEGCTLRYTTDGTAPTLTNGQVSEDGFFYTNGSTCYRFRLFREGYLPSPVVTRSYIKTTAAEPFPIISLVSERANIFDNKFALYSQSEYGRAGNGQDSKCNWNMDWDRPVNFEYITTDGKCTFSQEVDMAACGGWSRAWTPHSFKLKANKQYDGLNSMDYQFFSEKPFLKHKTLQIRNGGNDTGCRIKDAALQQIIGRSGLYVEHQSWQPVHVYVNAVPYAVLNMREPNNKHYGYSNYGIDTDYMDQFEICPDSGYVQMEGTKTAFKRLYTLSKSAAQATSYDEICKLVDIDEYVNYMAVELYLGGTDWPQNNVKGFRDAIDGKFRFVLFDLDGTFATTTPLSTFSGKQNYTFDMLRGYDYSKGQSIQGTRLSKENEFVTIFKNMLNNDEFKKKFVDAYSLVAGSVFDPERSNAIIDEMAAYLSQGGYVNPYNTANNLKSSLSNRQSTLINHLKTYLSLETPTTVKLSSNIDVAGLQVNDMQIPTGKFNGKLFAPSVLKASAPAGYKFVGWKDNTIGTDFTEKVFEYNAQWKYSTTNFGNTRWTGTEANYSDASWSKGNAPLGYGKTQNTVLTANRAAYYFRKSFELKDVKSDDVFTLNYVLDDGCVVYVNGQEVMRDNMPSGTVTYSTLATTYAQNNPNTGSRLIAASYFKEGTNVIAVEVHNNNTSSSDILWDAELVRQTTDDSRATYLATTEEFTLPSDQSALDVVAVWKKLPAEDFVYQRNVPVKINEISAGNDAMVNDYFKKDDWVELYNTTDQDLDCTGLYLSDNASKPTKYMIKANAEQQTNVIIPAHGKLIVWCSKRETASQLHANFKLGNTDGSLIMLSSSKEFEENNAAYFSTHPEMAAFTDTLYYNAHNADQSVGRFPDGSNNYYVFNRPTIFASNTIQTSDIFAGKDVILVKALIGDANSDGKVDMDDAKAVMKAHLGLGTVNEKNADVNGDGKITMADANAIINMIQEQQ